MRNAFLAAAVFFFLVQSSKAETYTWLGTDGSFYWGESPYNWDPPGVPEEGDAVIIPDLGVGQAWEPVVVDSITILGDGLFVFNEAVTTRILNISADGEVGFSKASTVQNLIANSGTSSGSEIALLAPLKITGHLFLNGSASTIFIITQTGTGALEINQTCNAEIKGSVTINGTPVRNYGQLLLHPGTSINTIQSTISNKNGGVITVNETNVQITGTGTVNNEGSVKIGTSGYLMVTTAFINQGSVDVNSGGMLDLSYNGSTLHEGTFANKGNMFFTRGNHTFNNLVGYGGYVYFTNTNINVNGNFLATIISRQSNVTFFTPYTSNSSLIRNIVMEGGTLEFKQPSSVNAISLSKGPWYFVFTELTVIGAFTADADLGPCDMKGSSLYFLTTCTAIVRAQNRFSLDAMEFENQGNLAIHVNNSAILAFFNTPFTNKGTTGIYSPDPSITVFGGANCAFANYGNWIVDFSSNDGGALTLQLLFYNLGNFTIEQGTVYLDCSSQTTHSGDFSGAGRIDFTTGQHTLEATSSIRTFGISFTEATTTARGLISVEEIIFFGGTTVFEKPVDVATANFYEGSVRFATNVSLQEIIMYGGALQFDGDADLEHFSLLHKFATVNFKKEACLKHLSITGGNLTFATSLTVRDTFNISSTLPACFRSTNARGEFHLLKGSTSIFNGRGADRTFESVQINNWGHVTYRDTIQLKSGSAWKNHPDSELEFDGSSYYVELGTSSPAQHYIYNYGTIRVVDPYYNITISPRLTNYGQLFLPLDGIQMTLNGVFDQNSGITSITGGILKASTFNMKAGILEGHGTIEGTVIHRSGIIRPGGDSETGTFTFTNYNATEDSIWEMQAENSFLTDQIVVLSPTELPGIIRFNTLYEGEQDGTTFVELVTAESFGSRIPQFISSQYFVQGNIGETQVQITVGKAANFTCNSGCAVGYCVGPNNCACDPGMEGNTCSAPQCPDGCSNGGTCTGNNYCECVGEFSGFMCTISYGCGCFSNQTCTGAPPHEEGSTTTTDTTATDMTTSESNLLDSPDDSPRGAIIGGAVGGVALLAMLAVLVALLIMRSRKRKALKTKADLELNPLPDQTPKINWQQGLKNIQIHERLGGGNFGDVYKGEWNGATAIALKMVRYLHMLNDFLREASILGSLNHPNVVRYFGYYMDDKEDRYIVMEFLPLGSLDSWVKKNELSETDLLAIAVQAAAGMAYLESMRIIHRDLALRNLLISKEDNKFVVKVADFGMSRTTEEGIYMMSSEGQIPYKWCSPEAIEGRFSTASDVWAFGVTLWELYSSAEMPYKGMNNKQAADQVKEGYRLPKPEECPDEIYELMTRCWAAKPEDRPSFAKIHSILKEASEAEEENLYSNRGESLGLYQITTASRVYHYNT
eukprot:TRINITY_DN1133_c0_g1_i3.p1 TRINITY_DN1133_c0_g1~~TRINITY_DN1133_c0_g1_i3.p1  ORF type:complete len:1385 (+),score=262.55 TRINITY_DN1133_c0_g1_i3:75-4229(+)